MNLGFDGDGGRNRLHVEQLHIAENRFVLVDLNQILDLGSSTTRVQTLEARMGDTNPWGHLSLMASHPTLPLLATTGAYEDAVWNYTSYG
jgi:hypothetical protein